MEEIETKNHGILSKPNLIVNLDETKVETTFGKREKAFTASNSHHGGFRGEQTVYGAQQHITAVVIATASGRIAPPFFIVEAKRLNPRWWAPVKGDFGESVSGICAKFTKPNWFPQDGVIKVADKGSMEKSILVAAVKHMNKFVRNFLKDESYVLCLDGHSSRKGTQWIEECCSNKCEVLLKPANTSHFLQACDQDINKRFKEGIREIRDSFRRLGMVDTRQVNFNLACAVYAYECITSKTMTDSFRATGVYPFQKDFALRFLTTEDRQGQLAEIEKMKIANGGPSSSVRSLRKRRSDTETMQEVQNIFSRGLGPSKTLQQLSIVLRNAETVNNTLLSAGPTRTASTAHSSNTKRVKTIDPGAPAECLTLPEVFERRREKEEKEVQEERERKKQKMQRDADRVVRADQERVKKLKKEADQRRKQKEREERKLVLRHKQEAQQAQRVQRAMLLSQQRLQTAAAKERATEAKELARKLSRQVAAARSEARRSRRRIKRNAGDREQKLPYLGSYRFAALIVCETVLAAVNGTSVEVAVRD